MLLRYGSISDHGTLVTGSAAESGETPPTLVIAQGPTVELPAHVRNLDARDVDGVGLVCAWKGQDGRPYWYVRGGAVVAGAGLVHGDEAIKVDPRGDVVWVDADGAGTHLVRRALSDGRRAREPIPAHRVGTSQGIAQIHADGRIVWGDDQLHERRQAGGRGWYRHVEIGPWIVGQTDRDPAIMAWHQDRQQLYRVLETTSLWRPAAAVVQGQLVVVTSLPYGVRREEHFEPVDLTTRPYAPVVGIGRPLWMGFYEFEPAAGLPANCRIPVHQGAPWLHVEGPGWAYVAGDPDGDLTAIEVAIAEARTHLDADIVAYVPRRAQYGLPTVADVQGIECYLGVDETDDAFGLRITEAIHRSHRCALIAQCYTSNATLTPDLRRLPGLIARLARDHASVEAILIFSGSGRATGWQDHPEVHEAWRQVFAGITGTPVVETPPVPVPEPVEPQPIPDPVEPAPVEPTPDPVPQPIQAEPGQYTPWQPRRNWWLRVVDAIARVFR